MATVPPASAPQPWSVAWARAAAAFYATRAPSDHFRTSAHVGTSLARALAPLVEGVDAALGHPASLDLVDVGAGDGGVLASLLDLLPPDVAARARASAVDVRPRPAGLDPRVAWLQGRAPDIVPEGIRGLLLAHELLDDVPCDVVEADDDGVPRLVLVDDRGVEVTGPALADDDAWAAYGLDASRARAWLSAWWPLHSPGERAEVGLTRDDLWTATVARLDEGTALAVDFGHRRETRPGTGSLAGYHEGRSAAPVPDGGCNLTAHVAVDAVAHRVGGRLQRQRDAVLAAGVSGALPPHDLASTDPAAYLDALARTTQDAELLDPHGLGAFWWVRTDV